MKKVKAKPKQPYQIRIIAGQLRGRKIPVLDQPGLRPSTDRVRETVFNWLMYKINGARCLDLFAGSGAFGFECLSRGAKFVQFVELNLKAANAIEKLGLEFSNQKNYLEQMAVYSGSAKTFLKSSQPHQFDVVFLDPPFDENILEGLCQKLDETDLLAEGAMIYIESRLGVIAQVPNSWKKLKAAKAGEVSYQLYQNDCPEI